MKKRIISMLLVLTMMIGMTPAFGVNVGAKTADQMTEAEAWEAGLDVYIAWYNHHDEDTSSTSISYLYEISKFDQLYDSVFPDFDTRTKKVDDAFEYIEKHFNLHSETDSLEYNLYMSMLTDCFYYYDEESRENAEELNYTADQLQTINSIFSNLLIEEGIDLYFEMPELFGGSGGGFHVAEKIFGELSIGKFKNIGEFGDILGPAGTITIGLLEGANEAAKYTNLSLLNDEFAAILKELSEEAYVSVMKEVANDLYEDVVNETDKIATSLKENGFQDAAADILFDNLTKIGYEVILDWGMKAATAASGAAGATVSAPAVIAVGAKIIGGVALGLAIGNAMENISKAASDVFWGTHSKHSANLTLYFMDHIRGTLYWHCYKPALADFLLNPTADNARRLNTVSKLMYNVLLCENDCAYNCAETYNSAGLLTDIFQMNNYAPFKENVKIRGTTIQRERNNYTENALSAYLSFSENKVYTVCFNTMGGKFIGLENMGISPEGYKTRKCNSIPIEIPEAIPTRTGYKFVGWSASPTSQQVNYLPGDTYSTEGDATLYAVWKTSITYNANGGTGAPASHENTVGNTTLSTTVPTRTGHTFLGWSESATATTATYQPGDVLTKEGNVTLYAIWEAGVFDIVFHANGGKFSGNTDTYTMQKVYGEPFNIVPPIPTWANNEQEFTGEWAEKVDGGYTIYQNDTMSDIDGKPGLHTRHFYAQWRKLKTSAIFTYDYTNCTSDPITVPLTNGSATVTLIDPPASKVSEIGKEFVQWKYYYPDGSGYKYYQTGDTITITDDFTVYAEWADPASGALLSVLTDKTSYLPGDTVTLTITADNTGYFTVDVSDNNGFKIKCADGSTASSGVFVEKSSASTFNTLKCYDNGSAYTVKVYIPNNCSDGSYTVNIVASNGTYGVSGTETSKATETITITVDTSEEEVATYVLSYDLNGGHGSIPDSEYFEEYEPVELADDSYFEREGYEFAGWSKDNDGGGKTYKAGRDYEFGESVVLYAIWEPIPGYGKLNLDLMVERYSKVYKPGETAHVFVYPDYSNHFYFDVSSCSGFTVKGPAGNKLTGATWFDKTSPNYDSSKEGYTDGGMIPIYIYIPNNCRDGQYTFFVTASNGVLDNSGNSDGDKVKKSVTIYVRESDEADSIHLSQNAMTIHLGNDKDIDATVEPSYIFNHYNEKEVTWKTSNSRVASIDAKGNTVEVFGGKVGTATITATVDGVSATCQVTVVRHDHSQRIIESEYLASPATCASQATYYYVCECGDVGTSTYKHGNLAAHNYSAWSVIQQPTETTAGVEQRTCSGCQDTEERSIPATGAHTAHTPGTAWHSDSKKHWHVCSVDGCTVKLDEGTHNFGELSVETPATETNTGVGYRTCACGYSKSETIPVLTHTHTWDPVMYTWAADGSSCTAQRVCSKDSNHKETATATITSEVKIPATEAVEGTTTYTATFAENWAVKQTKDIQDIPVTSHVHAWGTVTYTWAADGSSCTAQRVCTKDSNHKETATATISSAVKIPATETVKGTTTYTATFTESWAAKQTKDIQNIPVTSHVHTWSTVTYTWAADGSSCTAQRVCTKDSNHKETATATITSAVKIPATETVEGTTTYTATFAENWAVKQTKDIQDIPVTSHVHAWGTVTYTWAVDGSSCTAQRACTKDSNHKETATATITSAVKIPATETVEGTTTYTATFAENWAVKQTKDIQDIPVTSHVHTWSTVTYTWAADGSSCTAQRVCTKDSNHKETATATISSAVKIPATETVEGTTTYTATFTESWAAKQTKDIQDIPAIASGYDEDFWYWYLMMIYSQEFNISASANAGGTISPEGISKVKYGKNITYTITPDEGYAIADVLVDGKSVGAVSEYTIKRVNTSHTITAIFEKNEWKNPFADVSKEAWYYEDVKFVYENDFMIGTGADVFSPDAIVNRAMFVTVLWRLEGSPIVDSPIDFVDVPVNEWYTDAINWASANGIVNGYGNGLFGPLDNVTREQIAVIMCRYASYKGMIEETISTGIFYYTYSEWAENNVIWACRIGLFDDIGIDISNLTEEASRAEIAAYLRRFCALLEKNN